MKFTGTDNYVATEELQMAVNAAVTLQRPLLIKGEPGTGKTLLAEEVAKALGKPLLAWHIKSTTKAQQGLYEYDAVSRLRDSQLGSDKVQDIGNYISKGKLWEAFTADEQVVLLIDEIDKADIEFPNDLLLELDRMEFHVYETGETIKAIQRPIVIITSNGHRVAWRVLSVNGAEKESPPWCDENHPRAKRCGRGERMLNCLTKIITSAQEKLGV